MAGGQNFDFRKAINDQARVSDLQNLASSGVRKVKVLDEAALLEMIEQAVAQVVSNQTASERSKILADARKQLAQLMNERDQANSLATATRNQLADQVEKLQRELSLRRQVEDEAPLLRQRLEELEAENRALREGNDRMVEDLDRLQTENRQLREEIERLRAELEQLRAQAAEVDPLREELEMQRARSSGLEAQLAPLQQELETLRQELEEARQAGSTAAGAVRKELDRAREHASKLERELEAARRLEITRAAEEDRLRQEIEARRARAAELEDELRDLNDSAKAKLMEAKEEARRLRELAARPAPPAPLPPAENVLEEVPIPLVMPEVEEAAAPPPPPPEPVVETPPPPTLVPEPAPAAMVPIPAAESAPPLQPPGPDPVPAEPLAAAPSLVPLPEGAKPGKGLDVGTVNLVSACQVGGGDVEIRQQRNVFIDVEITTYTKAMLTRLNVPYVIQAKRMYVLGEPAFQLANVLNRRTRRPMKDGLISPRETDALPVMKMLIGSILGEPRAVQEVCFYSVPGDPVDSDLSVAYHRDLFDAVLKSLGYKPSHILEGHAVTFAELAEEDFTGIGISCGGGMFNVCVAYKSMPALTFSTARSGDWVDLNVAQALGIKPEKAAQIKEQGVDLMAPKNREEDAIAIYYRNLVKYNVTNIAERFRAAENMPTFNDPVSIVFSGGTAKAGNFIELVKDVFKTVDFPLPVKDIRLAKDALNATAKGALVAAQLEMASRPS